MAQLSDYPVGARVTGGGLWTKMSTAASTGLQKLMGGAVLSTDEGLPMMGRNDETWRGLRLDRTGGLAIAQPNLLLHEPVDGTTIHPYRWNALASSMVQAQTATGINLNSTNLTNVSSYSYLTSTKQFSRMQRAPLHFRCRARISAVANSQIDFGFGAPSLMSAITNGAYWVQDTGGAVTPAIVFNSGAPITGTNIAGLLNAANYYVWDIVIDDDQVSFMCQDSATGLIISEQILRMPLAQTRLFALSHLPCFFRVFNNATGPSSAPAFLVSDVFVGTLDLQSSRDWTTALAANHQSGIIWPATLGQATQWANSAAEGTASLSNTLALYTSPFGRFNFAAPAGNAPQALVHLRDKVIATIRKRGSQIRPAREAFAANPKAAIRLLMRS